MKNYFINKIKRPAYTYAQVQRAKLLAVRALKWLLIACGWLLFWRLLGAFMWMCYYAGVPM